MRKRNTLYTANKWNQPLFAQGVDRENQNIFDGAVDSVINQKLILPNVSDTLKNMPTLTRDMVSPWIYKPIPNPGLASKIGGAGLGILGGAANTMLNKALSGGFNTGVGNGIATVGNAAGQIVSAIPGVGALAGPAVQAISGAVGGLWNHTFGMKTDQKKLDNMAENASNMRSTGNALATSRDTSSFLDAAGRLGRPEYLAAYKGGWARKGKARKLNRQQYGLQDAAYAFQNHGLLTGADDVDTSLDDTAFVKSAAYGGPLDMIGNIGDMGVIQYDMLDRYLTAKDKQAASKDTIKGLSPVSVFEDGGEIHIKHPGRLTELKKRTGKTEAELWAEGKPEVRKMITFARNARKWQKAYGGFLDAADNLFALGGDIQMHGSDFTTGLTHVNAGKSHEENPNDGVQMGVDPEGKPNLVEENETIFNDYVYSNRIYADGGTLQKFHLPKNKKITYAEISKRLEKESSERPNDPISLAAFKSQMESLAEEQERQKAEMEAEKAQQAFASLTPEEQVELMQYAEGQQQQEAMAQEQAMQEQAMAEQQQMSPEEQMMQEQMLAQQAQQEMSQPPVMAAYGGEVNTFAKGDKMNVGSWKEGRTVSNMWNKYSGAGLKKYLSDIAKRIELAETTEEKNAIRQEAINTVSGIQQAYRNAYRPGLSAVGREDTVRTLQDLFNTSGGNYNFGNIAEDINIPANAYNEDIAENYLDGLWGPRTSIRNWGSTEYGNDEYYKELADLANQAGLVYRPNEKWTYGDETSPYRLYELAIANETSPVASKGRIIHQMIGGDQLPDDQSKWVGVGDVVGEPITLDDGTIVIQHAPAANAIEAQKEEALKADIKADEAVAKAAGVTPRNLEVVPNLKNESLRYAGLLGPAVALGLMGLGVGKPDYSDLNAALDVYRNGPAQGTYKPIRGYMTYNPMDVWAGQNRADARSMGAQRALENSSAFNGAGILANAYNSQLGLGQLYRQGLEYNDALAKQVADFNRGTDQYNSQAFNTMSSANAQMRNQYNAQRAQMMAHTAAQKEAARAGWYNSMYGNIGQIFKGISDVGRENAQHNMIAKMAASGIFGTMTPENAVASGFLKWADENTAAEGGNVNKKKNRRRRGGLII